MSTATANTRSPAQSGFYMPAEWEAHDRCWMMWPCRDGFWDDMDAARKSFVDVAQAIRRFEPVTVVAPEADAKLASSMLGADIEIMVAAIDDSWSRDAGPNFLINDAGELAGSCWRFNAWGGKYDPYINDDAIGAEILSATGAQVYTSEMIAEGGAISVDGEGTVITTESCLLHTNRNPGWTRGEIETELCRTLGASKVIWLPGNDDEVETNGHVDGIAAFVRPGVVLLETSFDRDHPWYEIFQENLNAVRGQTDANGRELDIVFIEDAWGCKEIGDRFCMSYINSYLANGAVIMPEYGIPADARAAAVYQYLYPDREIVPVNIDGIAVGGGGIHCITQQQPSVRNRAVE